MATRFYAGVLARSTAVVLAFWLVACGGRATPATPPVARVTLDWIEKAEAEERLRKHQRARLLYLRAKRESPDDHSRAYAASKYAGTLMHWGELEAARKELDEATRLDPGKPGYWHNLGHVEHHLGHDSAAEAALRRSIQLAPRDPRSHRSLAALLWGQQRLDETIAVYERMLELELPARIRASIRDKALPRLRAAQKRGAGVPR